MLGEAITLTNEKDDKLLLKRAECLLKMKKPLSARKDCDLALEINPKNGDAYYIRAKANMLIENYDDAKRDFENAHKILNTKETYLMFKEADKALDELKKKQLNEKLLKEMKFDQKKIEKIKKSPSMQIYYCKLTNILQQL